MAALVAAPAAAVASTESLEDLPALRTYASAGSRLFGCAAASPELLADPEFAAAVSRECAIIVPEWELKRGAIQTSLGAYDFSGGDRLLRFAGENGLQLRGHTLVWYYGNPPWLEAELRDNPRESLLTDLITEACRHYRGHIHSWDVVNELVEPDQGGPGGWRFNSPWYQAFGESFVATAFHAAREADPAALLFYGDYNVESLGRRDDARRRAVLGILETLLRHQVPIDGFGIQGHLRAYGPDFDEGVFERFLKEVSDMGLRIMVTELDVADRGGPTSPERRDADVAALTRRFLDVALANPAVDGVLTWGLSDRYSWLSRYPDYRWPDGQLSRGLPLDGGLHRKPMWTAIAESLKAAG